MWIRHGVARKSKVDDSDNNDQHRATSYAVVRIATLSQRFIRETGRLSNETIDRLTMMLDLPLVRKVDV